MSRFRNTTTNVVVNVDDTKDDRFGDGWERLDTESAESAPEGEPTPKWKVDQLKAYAESHGVDLGEAKTKPDILAVLGVNGN